LTFGTPPYISGTVEARNFKFGMEIDLSRAESGSLPKVFSLGQLPLPVWPTVGLDKSKYLLTISI